MVDLKSRIKKDLEGAGREAQAAGTAAEKATKKAGREAGMAAEKAGRDVKGIGKKLKRK